MRVLNVLHILRRHDQAKIGQRFHTPAGESRQRHRLRAQFARHLQPAHDIFRIAASGNRENQIVFFRKVAKLLGENFSVAGIVRPRGHERHIVGQRNRAQPPPPRRSGTFADVAGKVRRQRRAAAIAEKKQRASVFVALPNRLGHAVHHRGIEPVENPAYLREVFSRSPQRLRLHRAMFCGFQKKASMLITNEFKNIAATKIRQRSSALCGHLRFRRLGIFAQHHALALEFKFAAAPGDFCSRKTHAPDNETKQIARRIEPDLFQQRLVAQHQPADGPRFNPTIHYGPAKKRKAPAPVTQKSRGQQTQNPEGHRKNQAHADVAFGAAIARGDRPAQLVLPHFFEGALIDDVIDDVAGEHDAVAGFVDQVAQNKIVRGIIVEFFVAADFFERFAAHGDGRAEAELHAFEEIRDQHAGGFFHGHAHGALIGPEIADVFSAIEASGHGDSGLEQWRHYFAQIIPRHFDVAVGSDEDLVPGFLREAMQRIGLRIRPGGYAVNHNAVGHLRIARGDFADNFDGGIAGGVSAKQNFELRIVLAEKTLDVFAELRLEAVDGLDHGNRGKLRNSRRRIEKFAGLFAEFQNGREGQKQIDRGTQSPDQGDGQQNVRNYGQIRASSKFGDLRFLAGVEQFRILDQREHGFAQGFARISPAAPAQPADAIGVQANDGDITFPAAVAAREIKSNFARVQPHALAGQLGDFAHGDVIAGGHVVGLKFRSGFFVGEQNGGNDVLHVDVGFTLQAVAQNAEFFRLLTQRPDKIKTNAVRLPGAYHISETKNAATDIEHMAIRANEHFAGEFAGAISGDRDHGAVIFASFDGSQIAVDAAAGGVEDALGGSEAHGFENALGEIGALAKIDVRLGGGTGDVGIGGEMNDDVAAI